MLGSSHKIDPLFLGEEINRLDKVIRLTKKYPSSIIITDSLYANLSSGLKHHIRPFDTIKFDEAEMQKTLYLVDYDTSNVAPSVSKAEKSLKDAKDIKTKKGMNMIYLDGQLSGDKIYDAIVSNFVSLGIYREQERTAADSQKIIRRLDKTKEV